jgi:hypothetical protein
MTEPIEQERMFARQENCLACVEQREWRRTHGGKGTLECEYCHRKSEREAIQLYGGG